MNPKIIALSTVALLCLGGGIFLATSGEKTGTLLSSEFATPDFATPENEFQTVVQNQTVDLSQVNFENRIFSSEGFSYILPETDENTLYLLVQPDTSEGTTVYSHFVEDVKIFLLGHTTEDLETTNYSAGYASMLQLFAMYAMVSAEYWMDEKILEEMLDDSQDSYEKVFDLISLHLEGSIKYTENSDILVGNVAVSHHILECFVESEMDGSELLVGEIFHCSYPDNSENYLEIVMFRRESPLKEEVYTSMIEEIVESFISNQQLMEYNQEGMAKFTSTSFSAYYNPSFFLAERTPYRINDETFYYAFDKIFLDMSETSEDLLSYLNITTIEGLSNFNFDDYEVLEKGEHRFHVGKEIMDIKLADGTISQKEVILSLIHDSAHYPELYTQMDLRTHNRGDDDLILAESDVNSINEMFSLIMDTFETNLSPELQKEYDAWWAKNGENILEYGTELGKIMNESRILDTERGFSVKYNPVTGSALRDGTHMGFSYLIPWPEADHSSTENQFTSERPDDLIGLMIDSRIAGNIIRFFSYDGRDPLSPEDFFYPTELEKLDVKGFELTHQEESQTISGKTFTVTTTRYPRGIDDGAWDHVVKQFHYTEKGRSYIIYAIGERGYVEDSVLEAMEFMCMTMEITQS